MVKYNEYIFNSLNELCDYFGIDMEKVFQRKERTKSTLEQAIKFCIDKEYIKRNVPEENIKKALYYLNTNKVNATAEDIVKKYNNNYIDRVSRKITTSDGYSVKDILNRLSKLNIIISRHTINGCIYQHPEFTMDDVLNYYINKSKVKTTFKEDCEKAGVDYMKAKRIRSNNKDLTREQIIEILLEDKNNGVERKRKPTQTKPNTQVIYKGKTYNSIKDCLSDYNININQYKYIKSRYNFNIIETLDFILDDKVKNREMPNIIINGVKYISIPKICKEFNLEISSTRIVQERIKKNISYEEVLLNYIPNSYINIFGELIIE